MPDLSRTDIGERTPPKTWLGMADVLITASKVAQADGDTVTSLALAIKAAECLKIHRLLDVKIEAVCGPLPSSHRGADDGNS